MKNSKALGRNLSLITDNLENTSAHHQSYDDDDDDDDDDDEHLLNPVIFLNRWNIFKN